MLQRCHWCAGNELYTAYHDNEWGMPLYDEQKLFELLILEGMQAGLSWITILNKRDNFRKAFDNFNIEKMACYDEHKICELLQNPGIIRNRLKIAAAINNAQALLNFQASGGNFSDYLWGFVDGKPMQNHWQKPTDIPVKTAISDQLSKSLGKLGFKFVGSTICYAFMQAAGMVNDHVVNCFAYLKCSAQSA